MEEERNIGKLFYKNGFEFTSLRTLVREAENVNLSDLLDRLLDLEKKMNSSAEIKDLAAYVEERLGSIEKIVNDDSYFNLSDATVRSEYNKQVKSIRDKFHYARHFIDAEAELKQQQDNYEKTLLSINQRLFKLDHDATISGEERNEQGAKLLDEKRIVVKDYNDALENYNRCQEAYDNSQKEFDLVDFRNGLLNNINKIEDAIKKSILDQSLDQNNKSKMDKILDLIRDIRETVVYYGLESTRAKKEFDDLCKKFSLKHLNKHEEVRKEEIVEEKPTLNPEPVISQPVYSAPVQENGPAEVVQTSIKDCVEKVYEDLKRLNPDVQFNLVDDPINPNFDGRIESSAFVHNLRLPDNFYYINNGISNKFSSSKDTVIIEIGVLTEKREEPHTIKEKEEHVENLGLFDKAKDVVAKLYKNSRVPENKKMRVKRNRTAIINPYAKSLLTSSSLSSISLDENNDLSDLPRVGLASGLKQNMQKLYHKIVSGTDAKVDTLENNSDELQAGDEKKTMTSIAKAASDMMTIFKKRVRGEIKSNKKKASEPIFNDSLDDLEADLQKALDSHQANTAEILDEPLSSGR